MQQTVNLILERPRTPTKGHVREQEMAKMLAITKTELPL